jgi:hypothetical protein
MNVPRRLYSTVPYEQTTAETLRAEGEEDHLYLIAPAGGELHDLDAARLGIQEYLDAHPGPPPLTPGGSPPTEGEPAPTEEKAVEQSTVEDKAVEGPSTPPTPRGRRAVDFPPETSRS